MKWSSFRCVNIIFGRWWLSNVNICFFFPIFNVRRRHLRLDCCFIIYLFHFSFLWLLLLLIALFSFFVGRQICTNSTAYGTHITQLSIEWLQFGGINRYLQLESFELTNGCGCGSGCGSKTTVLKVHLNLTFSRTLNWIDDVEAWVSSRRKHEERDTIQIL